MNAKDENFFVANRLRKGLKLLAGPRGCGKTTQLQDFFKVLTAEGVARSRILFIDAESAEIRRLASCEKLVGLVEGTLPHDGVTHVLIREVSALPDAEIFLGFLAASSRYEVAMTSSTRQIVSCGLGNYLAKLLVLNELRPRRTTTPSAALCRARWNEIFLKDVLSPRRILEVSIASRVAGYLSDNLGDPISLRQVASTVSPTRRLLSPHTIEAYLNALSDAYLVEKSIRFDLAEEAPQTTRYRYFFTDLALRNAQFGPAPERDDERIRMNEAWLRLRQSHDEVFVASGSKLVDFVTRTKGAVTFWHLGTTGLDTVARNRLAVR